MRGTRQIRRRLRLSVVVLAAVFGAGLLIPAAISWGASALPASSGAGGAAAVAAVPTPVSNGTAKRLGAYDASQTIRLTIGLRPPHLAAERRFLAAVQDKQSPLFHHYLTVPEWTARFGPSAASEHAVVAWATRHGLSVTHLYRNRLLVDLAGRVGAVEKALGVAINRYRLGSRTFFANARVPAVPRALSGIVQSIEGLSSLQTMFPASPGYREPASPAYVAGPVLQQGPHAAADGSRAKLRRAVAASRRGTRPHITNGAYDPTDIYSSQAYDYNALYRQGHCCNPLGNAGNSPPATSIAIATFGSQNLGDLSGFHTQYPYLAYNVQEVYIDGTPACCDAEGTMDMEWSTATSNSFGSFQNTAKVWVYDGANFNDSTFTDIYNQMVSDNNARVFTTSWSCTEIYGCSTSTMNSRDAIFSEMAGQGWSLVAASGDRGAYDDCAHPSVSFPASDPNVLGAGGSELGLSSGPSFTSEVAWSGGPDGCGSNDGGSGGGCSAVYSTPSFQSNHPCGPDSRAVPDLSLNADWFHTPQNFYFNGALSGNGGTSIVAPELAGFLAQEDSYLLAAGSICGSGSSACAPLGNANFPLYETALNGAPHNPFYDITSGCNSNNVGLGYCAGAGDDLVTGWGSANMLQLAWAFNWHLFSDDGRPQVTFTGPSPNVWYRTDQSVGISIADTGGGFPASGVAGFSDAWDTDPGDPTSEATPGSGNSFYSGPEFVNTSSGSLDLASAGQGCHTANVEAWDNMGLQAGDVTDGPLCYDSVPPTITAAPTVILQNNVGPISSTVPVTVSWKGTDATSGIKVFLLYGSTDGGAFAPIATTPLTSRTLNLAPGHTYRFEVAATDNAGNTSARLVGPTYTLSLVQETSSTLTYSSGWTEQALSGASGGSVRYAVTSGKTAALSFTGFDVGWISTVGARGSATVQLDARSPLTVNTFGTTTKTAHVVALASATQGPHKLTITVLGTAGHPRVDVDAFVILSRS